MKTKNDTKKYIQKRNTYSQDEILETKFNGKMLKKAMKYSVPYLKILVTMAVCMLIVGFLVLIPATLNKYIVDFVLTKFGLGIFDWQGLLIVLLSVWVGIIVIDIVFTFFRTIFMAKVGQSVVRDIRKNTYNNLQKLSFDYYDSRPMGKILVRVTTYLDDMASIFSNAIVTLLVDSVKIFMILVWLFVVDWRLTVVVLILMVPMSVLLVFVRRAVTKVGRIQRNKDSNKMAYLAENIQGAFVTKAFNRAEHNAEIYSGLCEDSFYNWKKFVRRNELFWPTSDGFLCLGLWPFTVRHLPSLLEFCLYLGL